MTRRPWTPAELQHLLRDYPDTPTQALARRLDRPLNSVYTKAASLGLKKSQAYLDSPAACRLRRGDGVGESHRFTKGHRPWNKNMKGFDSGGRSAETRFKPGNRTGRAAENYQQIGTERVTKDGYLQRKVNDDMPLQRRWKLVQRSDQDDDHAQIHLAAEKAHRRWCRTTAATVRGAAEAQAVLVTLIQCRTYPARLARIVGDMQSVTTVLATGTLGIGRDRLIEFEQRLVKAGIADNGLTH